jgi:hypothetical protein
MCGGHFKPSRNEPTTQRQELEKSFMANGFPPFAGQADGVAKTLCRKSFMHYEALIFCLLFYQEKSKAIKLKKLYLLFLYLHKGSKKEGKPTKIIYSLSFCLDTKERKNQGCIKISRICTLR